MQHLRILCLTVFSAWVATQPVFAAEPAAKPEVVTPKEVIKLLNGKDLSEFYTWLQDDRYEDPRGVFKLQPDGILRISGDGYGGLVTKKEYANYYLVLEYRWGTETHRNRKTASRDGGLLLHCQGPDGNLGATKDGPGPWMNSIECQIIEGGVGDILVLPGRLPDGTVLPASATTTVIRDEKGAPYWDPKGEKTTFKSGRINWYGRARDWKDVLGVRGPVDVDSPGQEWTKLECYMAGDTLTYVVNGTVVNRATGLKPDYGRILLQTECAEMFVRKYELHPLPKEIP